jgi:hypothetical protein
MKSSEKTAILNRMFLKQANKNLLDKNSKNLSKKYKNLTKKAKT